MDIDLVVQLLSSFDGKQVYPEFVTKEEVFDEVTKERQIKSDWAMIPDGEYYLSENKKDFGKIQAKTVVENGVFTVLQGSICAPTKEGWIPEARKMHR